MTESKSPHRQRWLAEIESVMRARGVRAARTVVLLPYAQLLPLMKKEWREMHPGLASPRFETTQSWTAAAEFAPAASDFSGDSALDVLTARALLEAAGLQAHAALAAPLLMEAARQLAPLAAAVSPAERAAWGERARAVSGGMAFALEAAIAQTAVAWLANSSYRSDAIFLSGLLEACDCLIVVPGWQRDPLIDGLKPVWGDKLHVMEAVEPIGTTDGKLRFHAAMNASDEARRAAHCVMDHLSAGRTPVAVTATDRALLRRLRAMLAAREVSIRDETGWTLSTTRAAAGVMAALRAVRWNASSDAVLDWLKHAPACGAPLLRDIEATLRRSAQRLWSQFVSQEQAGFDAKREGGAAEDGKAARLADIEAWRAPMRDAHALTEWLDLLRGLLVASGQWEALQQDEAGRAVLTALRLDDASLLQATEDGRPWLWARRRLSLAEFTQWVDQVLESASFKPEFPDEAQVIFLPMAQLLGRDFAAVVLPACDERRLPAAPEPDGLWSAAQRKEIGLPLREELQAIQAAIWRDALARPQVDVLWRTSDENGEPLLSSPLVQLAMLERDAAEESQSQEQRAEDGLAEAADTLPVTQRPAPAAAALVQHHISASAYQDLRHCPYRYFALRLLGLREAEEIEAELDKRDFGLWLHAVLQDFHARGAAEGCPREQRRVLLDEAAREATRSLRLAEDEFLPFLSAWPQVRDGYLEWLEGHEGEGWRFAEGEKDMVRHLGDLTLQGRMDRIDRSRGGVLVMDYKTESESVTSKRVNDPLEDVQLAFYAALMKDEVGVRAAYVNIGERGETRFKEQLEIEDVRDALIEGLEADMRRIAEGSPLPALGEGRVCETCAARGLCRKDWWVQQA